MVSMTSRAPALIGRHEELRTLDGLLQAAAMGRGGMALVGGDAGVGKTALVRHLKVMAAHRSMRVIEGRCSAAEMGVPYAPFMDALRFRIAKGESDAATQVLQPIIAHVAPLFAGLESGEDTAPATATAAPFDPIFGTLCRLSALGPILFIVEDLHWADATSRDLLHYIARRMSTLPMLFVATYRSDELHHLDGVQRLVAALTRERVASRIQLEQLDEKETAELIQAIIGTKPEPRVSTGVYERTEGNPLFIEEYVSALLKEGGVNALSTIANSLEAPPTLHDIVWDRLAPLAPESREALTVAAVIGRRFRFDVLTAALDWPEERLLGTLEDLVERRIVVEHTEGADESYSFRHSLVQEVLYGSTLGRRRRLWHRRIAVALEEIGGRGGLPHTMLAHHYRLAGDAHAARKHSVLAGDEAAGLCAWKDAEVMYEAALAALEREGGDAVVEAEILERMAEVAWWQNRLPAYEQYLLDALRIRRKLAHDAHAAKLLRRLGNAAAYQRGDILYATHMLEQALVLVSSDNSIERLLVLNDLARLHVKHGEWDVAAAMFQQSLTDSIAADEHAEQALAHVMLGSLAIHRGKISEGLERLERARALLRKGAHAPERGAEVYHEGIRAMVAARVHRRARSWVDDAIAYARKHGAHADLLIYQSYYAEVQRRSGHWDAALAAALSSVTELRSSGRAELREALRILGDLQRGRGDLTGARASYREAIALGEEDAVIGETLILIAEEKWAEAAIRLKAALEARPAADRLFVMRVLPLLVEAEAAAGAPKQAAADLQRLRDEVAECDYAAGHAALAQATGVVHAAAGKRPQAVRELRRAVDAWRELELPVDSARASLLLASEMVGSSHTQKQGLTIARQSAETFEELGAVLDIARAHQILRRGGVRVQRRPHAKQLPAPLNRLTGREAEVFSELARGATNKQIARTLSLSPRTVGNHVSSILEKLGCATRTEAARKSPLK